MAVQHLTSDIENELGQPYGSVHIKDYIYGKFDLSLACAKAIFAEIKEWEVAYLENNAQCFITSNSPVKVNNEESGYFEVNIKYFINPQEAKLHEDNISFEFGFEVANADLKANPWIQFSISPNKMLIFTPTTDLTDAVISRFESMDTQEIIRQINAMIFGFSEEYAISSKRELLEEVKPLVNFKDNRFESMEEMKKYLANR